MHVQWLVAGKLLSICWSLANGPSFHQRLSVMAAQFLHARRGVNGNWRHSFSILPAKSPFFQTPSPTMCASALVKKQDSGSLESNCCTPCAETKSKGLTSASMPQSVRVKKLDAGTLLSKHSEPRPKIGRVSVTCSRRLMIRPCVDNRSQECRHGETDALCIILQYQSRSFQLGLGCFVSNYPSHASKVA